MKTKIIFLFLVLLGLETFAQNGRPCYDRKNGNKSDVYSQNELKEILKTSGIYFDNLRSEIFSSINTAAERAKRKWRVTSIDSILNHTVYIEKSEYGDEIKNGYRLGDQIDYIQTRKTDGFYGVYRYDGISVRFIDPNCLNTQKEIYQNENETLSDSKDFNSSSEKKSENNSENSGNNSTPCTTINLNCYPEQQIPKFICSEWNYCVIWWSGSYYAVYQNGMSYQLQDFSGCNVITYTVGWFNSRNIYGQFRPEICFVRTYRHGHEHNCEWNWRPQKQRNNNCDRYTESYGSRVIPRGHNDGRRVINVGHGDNYNNGSTGRSTDNQRRTRIGNSNSPTGNSSYSSSPARSGSTSYSTPVRSGGSSGGQRSGGGNAHRR